MALLDFGRPARRSSGSGLTPIEGLGLAEIPVRMGASHRRTTSASSAGAKCRSEREKDMMKLTLAIAAALGAASIATPAMAQAQEQFLPSLVYRTGPYAPNGIP